VDGRPGTLVVQLAEGDSLNEALRAVVEAGIPVLAAELEGARLSDAFLAMTEAA
jgi:ABC-2 type transport system ATP-binding protein